MTTRRASLGHFDLAARPGAGLLNRLPRSRVLRPTRLEPVEDVLRARCRPQGEELVIRIGERPTAEEGAVYEVATVVCAGSRGLTVTWLTGTLSLRKVVTKVLRLGSHQVIR